MEENNDKVKVKGIKLESLVNIEISGAYAARVQSFLIYYGTFKTTDEVQKIIEELKTEEPKDEYSFHLLTLLMLIKEIEEKAEKQGLIEDLEIDKSEFNGN